LGALQNIGARALNFQHVCRPANSPGAAGRLPVLTFFSRSPGIKAGYYLYQLTATIFGKRYIIQNPLTHSGLQLAQVTIWVTLDPNT
jgi:hypothetical protein